MNVLTDLLCPLVVTTCLSLGLGGVVFEPLRAAGRGLREPLRFRLTDLIVLLAQLQLAAGLLLWISRARAVDDRTIATVFAIAQISIWWLDGVRMVSHAGVVGLLDRAWFLGLLIPLGYLASALLVLVPVGLLAIPLLMLDGLGNPQTFVLAMTILALIAIHLCVLWGFRLLCSTLIKDEGSRMKDEE